MANNLTIDCGTGAVSTSPMTTQQTSLYQAGAVQEQQNAAAATNAQTLVQKAQQALTANATYQAIASPTNAQNATQVQALTKQCNGIIRLLLGVLDSTTGT